MVIRVLRLFTLVALIISLGTTVALAAPAAISAADLVVLGVPSNAKKADVIRSLGKPTAEKSLTKSMYESAVSYGGVTFLFWENSGSSHIGCITIENRDATTARKVAVGDSVDKMLAAYGRDYKTRQGGGSLTYQYIWGRANSGDVHGLMFETKGGKIVGIVIYP
jgi:hypothetical protein